MTRLEQAEFFEPKNVHFKVKLSAAQYDALYAYSRRTGIPMGKVLRDGGMHTVDAAGALT